MKSLENLKNRREFLKISSAVGLGFMGLQAFVNHSVLADLPKSGENIGYGELIPDPNKIMDLPKGFSYIIISKKGNKMSDGFFVPGRPDGMATFTAGKDRLVLIRNHENSADDFADSPFGENYALLSKIDKAKFYDYGKGKMPSLGGTTTLVFNEKTQKVEQEFLSLAGTNRNCAGGKTPWKSWISCEEDVNKAGDTAEKNHGFNFEVAATLKPTLAEPIPLKAMGRFNHEALCVDQKTSIVYQTEDTHDGLIYRYLPYQAKNLGKGGKLQALAIKEQKSFDTRNWEGLKTEKLPLNKNLAVEWVDLDNVESPEDDLRYRGFEKGAARFARGEGIWFGKNEFYFACTNGGHIKKGQIFRYTLSPFEGQAREKENPAQLSLFVEPNNVEIVKNCDNLSISPWGDLIVCEDDPNPFLHGITPKGEFYRFGHNVGFQSELAGSVFSPSGKTLFVNIQDAGLTLAITGPWKS